MIPRRIRSGRWRARPNPLARAEAIFAASYRGTGEWIEARSYLTATICRIYGVPWSIVGIKARRTVHRHRSAHIPSANLNAWR